MKEKGVIFKEHGFIVKIKKERNDILINSL
jgi:hypothetical protein